MEEHPTHSPKHGLIMYWTDLQLWHPCWWTIWNGERDLKRQQRCRSIDATRNTMSTPKGIYCRLREVGIFKHCCTCSSRTRCLTWSWQTKSEKGVMCCNFPFHVVCQCCKSRFLPSKKQTVVNRYEIWCISINKNGRCIGGRKMEIFLALLVEYYVWRKRTTSIAT
jgi:hypothetical protein